MFEELFSAKVKNHTMERPSIAFGPLQAAKRGWMLAGNAGFSVWLEEGSGDVYLASGGGAVQKLDAATCDALCASKESADVTALRLAAETVASWTEATPPSPPVREVDDGVPPAEDQHAS